MALVIVLAAVLYFLLKSGGNQDGGDPDFGGTGTPEAGSSGGVVAGGSIPPVESLTQSYYGGKDALDNFTQAIAHLEGFDVPGARPTRDNNPGDLKIAPGMIGRDSNVGNNGIAIFSDVGDGWDALANYVTSHVQKHPEWDFYDYANWIFRGSTTAPSADALGNSDDYADQIASYVGADPTSTVSSFLGIGGN